MSDDASSPLTQRQRQVAELVAQRLTTKKIADRLGLSRRRVQDVVRELVLIVGVSPDEDDRLAIADWWRARHPDQQNAA